MRCDECVHWCDLETYNGDAKILDTRRCAKAVEAWEATEWNANNDRVVKPGLEGQKMFVEDGSSYRAILLTRADFFCAHFEAKGR